MKMHLLGNEKNIKKNVIFIIAQVTEFNATFCIDRAFEKKHSMFSFPSYCIPHSPEIILGHCRAQEPNLL